MSCGFELFLNLGFSGGGGCRGMSKAPVRSACLGMLADIARPESNCEVTNGIFLAIFLGRLQALVTLVAAAIRPEIEGHSTNLAGRASDRRKGRLVPIRLPTQPTPPMRRPIKGGRKEPAACIDAPADFAKGNAGYF